MGLLVCAGWGEDGHLRRRGEGVDETDLVERVSAVGELLGREEMLGDVRELERKTFGDVN